MKKDSVDDILARYFAPDADAGDLAKQVLTAARESARQTSRLLDKISILPDAVAWHISANVQVEPKSGNSWITDFGNADDGARLWVLLAEPEEVRRQVLGENG